MDSRFKKSWDADIKDVDKFALMKALWDVAESYFGDHTSWDTMKAKEIFDETRGDLRGVLVCGKLFEVDLSGDIAHYFVWDVEHGHDTFLTALRKVTKKSKLPPLWADIRGLDKFELMEMLWDEAGISVLGEDEAARRKSIDYRQNSAKTRYKRFGDNFLFHGVCGRDLLVDLGGDMVDYTEYDDFYGVGTFNDALTKMRAKLRAARAQAGESSGTTNKPKISERRKKYR